MKNSVKCRSPIQVEALEQRCLLAGNVLAAVVFGELFVIGDSAANDIVIYQTDHETIKVFGRSDVTVTTVNGEQFFETCAPIHDVTVIMGGGGDGVNMALNVCDDLSVNTGAGDDFVSLADFSSLPEVMDADPTLVTPEIHGDLTITTGAGSDSVTVNFAIVSDDLTINTGLDADVVDMFGIAVSDETEIQMGAGDDMLGIALSTFDGPVTLRGGAGFDTLNINTIPNTFAVDPVISGFEVES